MDSHARDISFASACKPWAFPDAPREKKPVRARVLALRQSQDTRLARYKNRLIQKTVLELPEIHSAETLALYSAVRGEVDTGPLVASLLDRGKKIVLPRVEDGRMVFCRVRNPETDLAFGAYGIHEPDPACCEAISSETIDLFLAPGVAFDVFGSRIGFGGGFYDRLLNQTRPDSGVIALAFDFQVLQAVPAEPHDIRMDQIVTEEAHYRPYASRRVTLSEEETRSFARHLVDHGLREGGVVAFHGDLGTGKSVFVQGLAQALHTRESTASPTFVYCREYHGDIPLYHADAYRVESLSATDSDFWSELMSRPGLIAVEWAERLGALLPKQAVHLFGRVLEGDRREWTLFTPLRNQSPLHGEPYADSWY